MRFLEAQLIPGLSQMHRIRPLDGVSWMLPWSHLFTAMGQWTSAGVCEATAGCLARPHWKPTEEKLNYLSGMSRATIFSYFKREREVACWQFCEALMGIFTPEQELMRSEIETWTRTVTRQSRSLFSSSDFKSPRYTNNAHYNCNQCELSMAIHIIFLASHYHWWQPNLFKLKYYTANKVSVNFPLPKYQRQQCPLKQPPYASGFIQIQQNSTSEIMYQMQTIHTFGKQSPVGGVNTSIH